MSLPSTTSSTEFLLIDLVTGGSRGVTPRPVSVRLQRSVWVWLRTRLRPGQPARHRDPRSPAAAPSTVTPAACPAPAQSPGNSTCRAPNTSRWRPSTTGRRRSGAAPPAGCPAPQGQWIQAIHGRDQTIHGRETTRSPQSTRSTHSTRSTRSTRSSKWLRRKCHFVRMPLSM